MEWSNFSSHLGILSISEIPVPWEHLSEISDNLTRATVIKEVGREILGKNAYLGCFSSPLQITGQLIE